MSEVKILMKKKLTKKSAPKPDKLKLELRQIRADLKKLKKSKRRMQFLWYRTKKEHMALIKSLDIKLKTIKKKTARKKSVIKKPATKKSRAKRTK